MKRIWIVGEQNVWHVAPDQMLNLAQHRSRTLAARHVVALIIDADQVEAPAIVLDHCRSGPQEAHSLFAEQALGVVLDACINFVIAVASPNAQRSAQPAQ